MNKIKVCENEIVLTYPEKEETWVKSTTSLEFNDFISYNGYTYILKK